MITTGCFDDYNFVDAHEERTAKERRLYVERQEQLQRKADDQDDEGYKPPMRGPWVNREVSL